MYCFGCFGWYLGQSRTSFADFSVLCRLLGVWQWLYSITQQYMEELESFKDCDGWEEEQQQLSVMVSQIQTAVQAAGGRLQEGPTLLSYPGN